MKTKSLGARDGMHIFLAITLILLFLPTSLSSLSSGQQFHTVYGHAYYAADEPEPAAAATVTLLYEATGERLTTTTDVNGFFSFQLANLPSGWEDGKTIHITVAGAEGHAEWKAERSVSIDASSTAQALSDIYLSPTLQANFSYTPSAPSVNQTVVFTDSSTSADGIARYNWTFGDDTGYATGQEVTHAYNDSGTYTVTLTVTGQAGRHDSLTKNVTVAKGAGQDGQDGQDDGDSIPGFPLPVALVAILALLARKRTRTAFK